MAASHVSGPPGPGPGGRGPAVGPCGPWPAAMPVPGPTRSPMTGSAIPSTGSPKAQAVQLVVGLLSDLPQGQPVRRAAAGLRVTRADLHWVMPGLS